MVKRFTSFCEATSKITNSGPAEISASLPSGVNFRRLARGALAASVAVTFFCLNVDHGDGSVPRIRHPGLLVIRGNIEAFRPAPHGDHGFVPVAARRPGGPPPAPGIPGGAPGGGPGGMPAGPSVCSRIVTVAELTLVVRIFFASGKT